VRKVCDKTLPCESPPVPNAAACVPVVEPSAEVSSILPVPDTIHPVTTPHCPNPPVSKSPLVRAPGVGVGDGVGVGVDVGVGDGVGVGLGLPTAATRTLSSNASTLFVDGETSWKVSVVFELFATKVKLFATYLVSAPEPPCPKIDKVCDSKVELP
jgi:hypothetical protein